MPTRMGNSLICHSFGFYMWFKLFSWTKVGHWWTLYTPDQFFFWLRPNKMHNRKYCVRLVRFILIRSKSVTHVPDWSPSPGSLISWVLNPVNTAFSVPVMTNFVKCLVNVKAHALSSNCFHERPVQLNGWVFVYEPSGCGFESSCRHLNVIFHACPEQRVPWHSGNYRVWVHSETRTCHDKNIQSISEMIERSWMVFWELS